MILRSDVCDGRLRSWVDDVYVFDIFFGVRRIKLFIWCCRGFEVYVRVRICVWYYDV